MNALQFTDGRHHDLMLAISDLAATLDSVALYAQSEAHAQALETLTDRINALTPLLSAMLADTNGLRADTLSHARSTALADLSRDVTELTGSVHIALDKITRLEVLGARIASRLPEPPDES